MQGRRKLTVVLIVFSLVLLISSCNDILNEPPVVKNPHPANNATGVPINITLTWDAEDEEGDDLIYDVYFGKSSDPPLVKNWIREKKYNPGTLEYGTTYYWRVAAQDGQNRTKGPVWKFTTMSVPDRPPGIIWEKTLGGSGYEEAGNIQQTSDGGYIVVGGTYSNDGDVGGSRGYHEGGDVWIVKLDKDGKIEWQKALGGSEYDVAHSVQQTSDGGYIVAGETYSSDGDVSGYHEGGDAWIVKLDKDGNIQWQKALGGSDWDVAYSVQQTSDGGYIVAGWTASNDGDVSGSGYHGERDIWIIKLDSSGNIQWQKALGGSDDDWANGIQQTSDGGYIVAGGTYSNDGDVSGSGYHGKGDSWIVKLDSSGNIQWQKALGGSDDDWANSIQQTSDEGYIVAGWTASNDGDVSGWHEGYDSHDYPYSDCWVVKLDKDGNIEWKKALGGSGGDGAYSIQQTSDGGYIVAGWTASNDGDVSGWHEGHNEYNIAYSDYWVVKLDSSGNIEWQKALGGSGWDEAYSIQQTSDGGYIVAGWTESNDGDVSGNHGEGDVWIVKLGW